MEDPTVHVCCKGISNWSKPYRNSFFTRSWISTVRIGFIASGAQQESWTAFSPTFPQTGALWQLTAAQGASVGGLERAEAGSGWAVHLHKILKRSVDICVNWATSAETGDLWQCQTPPQDILRMSKPMQDKCPSKIPISWGRSICSEASLHQAHSDWRYHGTLDWRHASGRQRKWLVGASRA